MPDILNEIQDLNTAATEAAGIEYAEIIWRQAADESADDDPARLAELLRRLDLDLADVESDLAAARAIRNERRNIESAQRELPEWSTKAKAATERYEQAERELRELERERNEATSMAAKHASGARTTTLGRLRREAPRLRSAAATTGA